MSTIECVLRDACTAAIQEQTSELAATLASIAVSGTTLAIGRRLDQVQVSVSLRVLSAPERGVDTTHQFGRALMTLPTTENSAALMIHIEIQAAWAGASSRAGATFRSACTEVRAVCIETCAPGVAGGDEGDGVD